MSVEDRIESAFADETFKTTIAEVRRRRRTPLLRHKGLLVAALLLVGVVVAGWLVIPGRSAESASALDAACRRQWTAPTAMPPYLLGVGGRDGIRVYAAGSTAFYCVPGAIGRVGDDDNTSTAQLLPVGPMPDVAAMARAGSHVVYAGTVPLGTDRVEFSGGGDGAQVWPARLAGRHFAVEIPTGTATTYPVTLGAHGSYGVAVVPGPILHSSPMLPFGPEQCVSTAAELAKVPMLALYDPPASPTLKLRVVGVAPNGYEKDEAELLAAPGIMVVCRDGGVAAYFEMPDTDALTAYGPVYEGQWAVGGRVPAGTTSVTVTLDDGTSVPATVSGGYWLAWDSPDQTAVPQPRPSRPVSVTALTPAGRRTVRITG